MVKRKLTTEHKLKISLAMKRFYKEIPEEKKERIRLAHVGIKQSEEWIKKRVESKKGFRHSEETKRKISLLQKGNKNMLGKHLSEETKRKISETRKRLYKEGKLKPGQYGFKKGFKWNEETKKKMIDTMKKVIPKYDFGKHKYKFIKNKRQMPMSNFVWCVNNSLNRIPEGCLIHHIDGNRENNNIENLQLMPKGFHTKLHMAARDYLITI